MKRFLWLVCMSVLTLAAVAADYTTGNKSMDFTYRDGAVLVFLKGKETPVLTIRPALKGAVVPEMTVHPDSNYHIFSLRSPESSIAFRMDWQQPVFTMALNRGASPVTIEWNANAVILPDIYGENQVLQPQEGKRFLPPFVPMYVGLTENGDGMVSCIPHRAFQQAELSGDLKTLTLNQQHAEDYVFALTSAKGIWGTTLLSEELNKPKEVPGWTPPFAAEWMVSLPVNKDFIPAGDGIYATWPILRMVKKDDGKERSAVSLPRISLVDIASRGAWTSGFEGSFRYPAELVDGKLMLCGPRYNVRDRFLHDFKRPVYIYALKANNDTPKDSVLPWKYLPKWLASQELCFTTNFGISPPTCGTTNWVEAVFRRDEAKQKVDEISNRFRAMQFFVEAIRSRIENGRVWAKELAAFADQQLKAEPSLAESVTLLKTILAEYERLYAESLPRIQYPAETIRLAKEFVELAASDLDDEQKEEKAKELGRATRFIGGGQDNLCAYYRHIGKCIRFQALNEYGKADNPAVRSFWKDVYGKLVDMMQATFGHEGR